MVSAVCLVSCAFERFAINSQMNMLLVWFSDQPIEFFSTLLVCHLTHEPGSQPGIYLLAVQTRQHILIRIGTWHPFPTKTKPATQYCFLIFSPLAYSQHAAHSCPFREP